MSHGTTHASSDASSETNDHAPDRDDGTQDEPLSPTDVADLFARGRDAGPLRIAVASDHRGFAAKAAVLTVLADLGHDTSDLGCEEAKPCDYPDFAAPAARGVVGGKWHAAILLDGSGIGMGIVANKVPGCRAAICHDEVSARIAREHNHCNVLCLGTDLIGPETLLNIARVFLDTPFNAGRHTRRLAKIEAIEQESLRSSAVRSVG